MSQIRRYCTDAHLFHGSEQAGLTLLVPFDPSDIGSNPKNKERAVYASADVCAAIMFGLTRGFNGIWRLTLDPTTAHFPKAFEDRLRRNVGSLYVLARDQFGTREGWQYKAFAPVAPVAELAVSLGDYEQLGGLLHLVDDEHSLGLEETSEV